MLFILINFITHAIISTLTTNFFFIFQWPDWLDELVIFNYKF